MADIDELKSRVGETETSVEGFEIEAGKVAEFARAIGDDNPVYHSEDAARERGVLVNRADESGAREFGSVVVPATVRDGPVVAAVATGARSPALSRYLRERIEETIDGAGAMAEMTADLREDLADRLGPEERRPSMRAVVRSEEVWKALDTPGTNARQVATDVISDVRGDSR